MKHFFIAFLLLVNLVSFAQTKEEPIVWNFQSINLSDNTVELEITADLYGRFHLYSQHLEEGDGPIATEFNFVLGDAFELIGDAEEFGVEVEFDKTWEKDIASFAKKAKFIQKIKILKPDSTILTGNIKFMVCDDKQCMFLNEDFSVNLLDGKEVKPVENTEIKVDSSALSLMPVLENMDLDNPVFDDCTENKNDKTAVPENKKDGEKEEARSYWVLFVLGLIGGLVSLITPCVFPMIPLTVSFFTKGGSEKGKGIAKALLYGVSIVAVYVSLSIPFYFGAESESLSQISTSFWLNIFFFAIFLVFAFSFFGFYEIGLPSSWANKADKAADLGGFIGVIFMALVLAIVSFSCTGPLLGSVLASSLKDGAVPITVAMLGFGLGLGLPFTLFAAFPSMLKSLPQSGGWLNTVKVVLGFVELALALKFLSNADFVFQYGIVLRETFFLVWVVISLATAFYLFGFFKFPHDTPNTKISGTRKIIAVVFLSFGIYLIPGVLPQKTQPWNHGMISGFPPPYWYGWYATDASIIDGISLDIEDGNLKKEAETISDLDVLFDFIEKNNKDEIKIHYHITDYYVGQQYAQKVNRPMLLDFTGYACVNCRRMEENVWPKKGVKEVLERDYIVISLYVDDKNELPKDKQGTIPVPKADGTMRQKKLVTIGDRWSNFSILAFGQIAQPYYVLLSPDEYLLNTPVAYTPVVKEYADWLQCGLRAFESLKAGNVDLSEIDGGKTTVVTENSNHMTLQYEAIPQGDGSVELRFTGTLDKNWHTYSQFLGDEGPLPTIIEYYNDSLFEFVSEPKEENSHTYYDSIFEIEVTDFSEKAIFTRLIKPKTNESFEIKGKIRGQVCDEACINYEEEFTILVTQ